VREGPHAKTQKDAKEQGNIGRICPYGSRLGPNGLHGGGSLYRGLHHLSSAFSMTLCLNSYFHCGMVSKFLPSMNSSLLLPGRLPVFCSLLLLAHTASAQMVYQPETHAIPIPEMKDLPLAGGLFKGTVESLKQFQPPEWFQDGKFGIGQ